MPHPLIGQRATQMPRKCHPAYLASTALRANGPSTPLEHVIVWPSQRTVTRLLASQMVHIRANQLATVANPGHFTGSSTCGSDENMNIYDDG